MAENMTGILVENTMVVGTGVKRGQGRMPRIGLFGAVAAILAVLLIGSVAMHNRSTSHAVAPAIAHTMTSAEIRFLEQNTINLPNAVASDSRPDVVTSGQQRFLEENTTTLPSVGASNIPANVVTSEQWKFLEVNTNMPVPAPSSYMEEFTPQPGQPR